MGMKARLRENLRRWGVGSRDKTQTLTQLCSRVLSPDSSDHMSRMERSRGTRDKNVEPFLKSDSGTAECFTLNLCCFLSSFSFLSDIHLTPKNGSADAGYDVNHFA